MFDGRTGPRLIARLPVARNSYAIIGTDLTDQLKARHAVGLKWNGYPALSPVASTVFQLIRPMLTRRQELEVQLEQAYAELSEREAQQYPDDPLREALEQQNIDWRRRQLDRLRDSVERPMICSSIMIGRELTLHLPSTVFDTVSRVSAGFVQTIEIYNAPIDEE
ncbi:MAG TPA: hypothetical protein VFK03_01610 [Candidatus Saccharimonadales bacterium]|nr:hypothetical protein [Candidatus Saccharimonadales bacterium]